MISLNRILVVEDDKNMSYLLKKNLEEENFEVLCAFDGDEGWDVFTNNDIHLCVLDVMLPKHDGFTLAEMIRSMNTQVPILFLTAKSLKEDIYRGFEVGGDDYITKPFTAKELILRIHAIQKRLNNTQTYNGAHLVFQVGKFTFDHSLRQLIINGEVKKLSTKENEVLRIFCESRNVVLNRNRFLLEAWGKDDYFTSRSLDVYITRIRKLLKQDPSILIQNYHNIGYKMVVKQTIS